MGDKWGNRIWQKQNSQNRTLKESEVKEGRLAVYRRTSVNFRQVMVIFSGGDSEQQQQCLLLLIRGDEDEGEMISERGDEDDNGDRFRSLES